MAKDAKITRTLTTTKFKVLGVDMNEKQTHETEVTLPRTYKSDAEALKHLAAYFAGTNFKPVAVISSEVISTTYETTESKFLTIATPVEAKA